MSASVVVSVKELRGDSAVASGCRCAMKADTGVVAAAVRVKIESSGGSAEYTGIKRDTQKLQK